MVQKNLLEQKAYVIKAYQQVELFLSRLSPRNLDDFEISTQKILVNLQDTPVFDEQLASQGYSSDGFISKVQGVFMVEVTLIFHICKA